MGCRPGVHALRQGFRLIGPVPELREQYGNIEQAKIFQIIPSGPKGRSLYVSVGHGLPLILNHFDESVSSPEKAGVWRSPVSGLLQQREVTLPSAAGALSKTRGAGRQLRLAQRISGMANRSCGFFVPQKLRARAWGVERGCCAIQA